MIVPKKILALVLSALPFQAHGQIGCFNNQEFLFDRPGRQRNCNWITRDPSRVNQRRDNVCTLGSDVARNCAMACTGCTPPSSVLFTMTNSADGNEVIMRGRNPMTGRLSYPLALSTGGVGGDDTLETAPDDPLGSTDPLIVADNCVLACNAGSNTISSFELFVNNGLIESARRASIVGSGGDLPVSIAYSNNSDRIVYALNAGGPGSISGFRLNESCVLEAITNSIVSLNQGAMEGGPAFFISSPGQVGFTPDSDELIVTIKGIDGNPGGGGTIMRCDVDGSTGLISYPRFFETGLDGIVPFSFDFDGDDNLIVAMAFGQSPPGTPESGGVNVYSFEEDSAVDFSLNSIAFVGQTATCWVRYSNDCVFTTSNAGSSISSLRIENGILNLIDGQEMSLNNPVDISFSPDGQYLYAISTGHTTDLQPRIHVYDVSNACGLAEVQVTTEGLPGEAITVFGVVGLAIF